MVLDLIAVVLVVSLQVLVIVWNDLVQQVPSLLQVLVEVLVEADEVDFLVEVDDEVVEEVGKLDLYF